VGTLPDGFDEHLSSRFPRQFIEVYKVVCKYCATEELFQKYLPGRRKVMQAIIFMHCILYVHKSRYRSCSIKLAVQVADNGAGSG